MENARQGRLLVVDFDFFFHNPFEGLPAAHRGDPTLYDWAHTEAKPFLLDGIWMFRADDFYRAGITPPRCEGLDGFWDRFTFTSPRPPLFYADSNLYAGRLTPAHYALPAASTTTWQEVHLFDAHHDSGYPHPNGPATFKEWNEWREYSCEDWMLVHHANGSRLQLTYPAWRPDGDSHPPMIPLDTRIDDRAPVPDPFDAVFLCRSGTWVPSWCDDQFTELLQSFPGRTHLFPGAPWTHPRPDPLPQARRHAALFAQLTARLAPSPTPTAPASAHPPGPGRKTHQDLDDNPGSDAVMPQLTPATPEERAAAERAPQARPEQPAGDHIIPPAPAGPAGDEPALSYDEFRALFDDPDTLQAAQQHIARVEAASRQRLEQAAAALAPPLPGARRPSGSDAADHTARQAQAPTTPPAPGHRP